MQQTKDLPWENWQTDGEKIKRDAGRWPDREPWVRDATVPAEGSARDTVGGDSRARKEGELKKGIRHQHGIYGLPEVVLQEGLKARVAAAKSDEQAADPV